MTVTHGPMMPPAAAPPPPGWPTPVLPPPAAPRRKGWIAAIGIAIALSCAALGVGITALLRPTTQPPTTRPAASTHAPKATGTADANRAFCSDIAPLMAESNRTAQALSRLGKDSPEWDSGSRAFIADTKPWLARVQPVIDSHGDADPFLQRSMQRFVDDMRYLVADLEGGAAPKWLPYDQTIWNDSLAAGSGPLSMCWDLGVKW